MGLYPGWEPILGNSGASPLRSLWRSPEKQSLHSFPVSTNDKSKAFNKRGLHEQGGRWRAGHTPAGTALPAEISGPVYNTGWKGLCRSNQTGTQIPGTVPGPTCTWEGPRVVCVLGKSSTPYTTFSALNPTLTTHGSLTLLGKSTQSRHMDMASVLCMGTNSLLLMNTCHPTAASPHRSCSQGGRGRGKRKSQSSLRCLLPGEDLTGPLLLCGKVGAYLLGRQLRSRNSQCPQFEPSETACCFLPQVWQQWREKKINDTDR